MMTVAQDFHQIKSNH